MSKVISKVAVDLNFLKSREGSSIQSDTSSGNNLYGRSSRHNNNIGESSMFRASQSTRVAAVTTYFDSAFDNSAVTTPSANVASNVSAHFSSTWRRHVRWIVAMLLTLSCAVCFSGATYFSHRLFHWPTFHAPFFTAFFVSSWLILFFPAYVLVKFVTDRGSISSRILFTENLRLLRQDCLPQTSIHRLLGIFAGLILLWMLTHYVFLQGVEVVDTTDVMALFATNSNFVYILSWILLHKKFISTRILSFIISMTGIVMVTYKDTNFPSHILGCVLTLFANVLSACYKVFFIRLFGKCTSGQLSMCLSFLGVIQAVTLWPVWLLLYFIGWESIQWDCIPWNNLFIISLFAVGVIVMLTFGPLLTNIIFVRSAFVVAIVTGIASEALFNPAFQLENIQIVAYLLVFLGFVLNNLSQERLEQLANRCCSKKTDGTDMVYETSYHRIRRNTIPYS